MSPRPSFLALSLCLGSMTVAALAVGASVAEPAADPPALVQSGDASAPDEGPDAEGWYVERSTGIRYRIERIPKIKDTYQVIDESHVRLPFGTTFEYVRQDDEAFWVKAYEEALELAAKVAKPAPDPEALAKVAAQYPSSIPTVDRLELLAFDEGLPRGGQWRNTFAIADVNGDGHRDIVFGPARKSGSRPNVFLGDGAGRWQRWSSVVYPPEPYDYGAVAVADFDADGHLDLAFGIHLTGLLVLRGDGKGGFETWSEGIALSRDGRSAAFSSRAVEVADWNGDGRPDLVAFGEGPSRARTGPATLGTLVDTSRGFLVYLNEGGGKWTAFRPAPADRKSGDFGNDLAVADLDADGYTDLVSATSRRGNPFVLHFGGESRETTATALADLRPGAIIDAVATSDLDGDGQLDIVLAYRSRDLDHWRSGIDVFYGAGSRSFRRSGVFAVDSREGIMAVTVGDLDRDGRRDLLAATGNGQLLPLLQTDKGFSLETSSELPEPIPGCSAFDAHLADLDGDGGEEIVVAFAGEAVGLPGIGSDLSQPGCPDQGSIRAWKVKLRS